MLTFPPDWTFIFQIVLFLILWQCLRRWLFEPHLEVFRNREQRSAGAIQEASRVKTEAATMAEQYAAQLAQTRTGVMQAVDTVYRAAEEQARQLADGARAEAAQALSTMRETLSLEVAAARSDLERRVPEFAREISEKLLGRPLTS